MHGLVSVTFRKLNYKEIVELCNKAGIHCIEWGGDIHVPTGDYEKAAEVGAYSRAHGIHTFSYGSYYFLCKSAKEGMRFSTVLNTAQALGCSTIRIWAGNQGSSSSSDTYFHEAVSELKEICSTAQKHQIKIALEYHPNTLTDNKESALRLVKSVDSPNLFLYWQPNPDISLDERIRELNLLKPYICNVHVFSWEIGGIRYPLSHGTKEWHKYLKITDTPEIPYMLEFVKDDSEEQFLDDAETLKRILSKC